MSGNAAAGGLNRTDMNSPIGADIRDLVVGRLVGVTVKRFACLRDVPNLPQGFLFPPFCVRLF